MKRRMEGIHPPVLAYEERAGKTSLRPGETSGLGFSALRQVGLPGLSSHRYYVHFFDVHLLFVEAVI